MNKVTVSHAPSASRRTRNRLKENPGQFQVLKTKTAACMGGVVCHLLQHDNGWLGWVPVDEVILRTSNEHSNS